ncbi:MAG: AsmA family protein, partial [Pseudomonadales bacterium]|nr:AsmA family protein [Pseudomonadales bacterium]
MRPIIYIIVILLLIPVILIGALAVILANPDLYRQQLADTFKAETGFILDIKGDIAWRYWPLIALDVRDLEIRPGDNSEAIAKFQSASVDLELLPLLMGSNNIAIDGIFIDQLDINLQVDEAGKANWVSDTAEAPSDESDEAGSDGTFDLDIAVIEITDASIEYRDLAANQHYVAEIASLTTGSVFYDEPIDVIATLNVEDRIGKIQAQTNVDGRISFNQGFTHFTFQDLGLDNRVSGTDLPELAFLVTLSGEFESGENTSSI